VGGDEVMSVGLVRAVKEVKKSGILRGFGSWRSGCNELLEVVWLGCVGRVVV